MSGSGAISGGAASWSSNWTPTVLGTYHWIASYPGDANNQAYTTACGDPNEQIVVGQASPTITTFASPAFDTVGTAVTAGDSATLSSGNNPTGSVSFTLYSDAACTTSVMSGSGAISGGAASWSTSWTPTALGTYHWQASYAGDANNHASTTACGDPNEQIVVSAVGIAKRVVEIRSVSPGTYDVTLEMLVENYGDVPLTNVQVIDNLATTFPLPTTFTVQSLTSADFAINWPGYNGRSNTDLLKGTDSLAVKPAVKASGTLTLVLRVIPALAGPFNNTAIATAKDSKGDTLSDLSQDGANPDPDGDGNPTNNNDPTPISFGPTLFDPPIGVKTIDSSGIPLLKWTLIWINNTNLVGVNNVSHDPIPAGSTFTPNAVDSGYPVPTGAPTGSTSLGVACMAGTSTLTVTTLCYYEGPTLVNPRGQIIWAGTLGSDFGVTNPLLAVNAIHITFRVSVASGVTSIQNHAMIDTDLNGNGVTTDPGEQNVASASASWTAPAVLPFTGFAPGSVTALPEQSIDYGDLGNLWLEIPSLGVQMPIVGVPLGPDGWDVSWLGKNAGWLNGTAFPTSSGNSVITGHVYGADGLPGPFVNLKTLSWDDQVIIHYAGQRYIYKVRTNAVISPTDTSIFSHKDYPWLTLLTCKDYNIQTNSYAHRVAIGAVLVQIESDPSPGSPSTANQLSTK
jgi:LPXTG-site transpeptidase (sortase) family protein